ncbi:hypothetical protein ACFOZ5_01255 [Marinobacter lacisalsi]|uniref:Uncharacterized protein n=1 Tax=Marinobacter lacisalsi TaxID=475979 RepID=A0ABV8QDR7_9GAMM
MKHLKLITFKCCGGLPFLLAVIASLSLTGMVQADPLSSGQIQSFLDTRADLEGFDDNYPGLEKASDQQRDMTRPMSSALPALDEFPDARDELEAIVGKHGFDSIEEWAHVGDRVFMAQIAISMQDMSAEERAMSEAMMSSDYGEDMPAPMRERAREMAKQGKTMMDAAKNVPEEDMEAVRPFMGELDPEEYE